MVRCQECGQEFDDCAGLHKHIKVHGMYVADYYIKHYPRHNKLTGELLPFKNKDDYFENDFTSREQMLEWCQLKVREGAIEEVKRYAISLIQKRVWNKHYTKAPSHLEFENRQLPSVRLLREIFGSFAAACEDIGVPPMFTKNLPREWEQTFNPKIFVDTREQTPFQFDKSERMKLDFGDYALAGEDFNNIYIDRKNPQDFLGTFGAQADRFRKEMKRCIELNGYMFILVEKPLKRIEKEDCSIGRNQDKKVKFAWICSNMFSIQHEFSEHCQFIFADSKEHAQEIAPKLLMLGPKLKDVDVQYFLDNANIL